MFHTRSAPLRKVIAISIAMTVLVLSGGIADAHEMRTVGDYTLFVGFRSEPAIVEQPNAVEMLVRQGASEDAKPVTGLSNAIKADVKFGAQTMTVSLEEVDGSPGDYIGSFIPTAEGPYTFRIYGAINGTTVDESFTSGPQTFSEVESSSSLQFPSRIPAVASVAQTATNAGNAADTARTLAIVGIIVGALGLIAGVAGVVAARGSRMGKPIITGIAVSGETAEPTPRS